MKLNQRQLKILKMLSEPIPETSTDYDDVVISREEAARLYKQISDADIFSAVNALEKYLHASLWKGGYIKFSPTQTLSLANKAKRMLVPERIWEEMQQWFDDDVIKMCCLFTKRSIKMGLQKAGYACSFKEIWNELEKSAAYRLTEKIIVRNYKNDNKRT